MICSLDREVLVAVVQELGVKEKNLSRVLASSPHNYELQDDYIRVHTRLSYFQKLLQYKPIESMRVSTDENPS